MVLTYQSEMVKMVFKILFQLFDIMQILLNVIERPHVILVQTPPAIPLLGVVRFVSFLFLQCQLVIDWHNFGYTLLSLQPQTQSLQSYTSGDNSQNRPKNDPQSTLIAIAYQLERISGYFANNSFCVTHAMKEWLVDEWRINANALHDQPPHIFIPSQKLPIPHKHQLFIKFQQQYTLLGLYQESMYQRQPLAPTNPLLKHIPSFWYHQACPTIDSFPQLLPTSSTIVVDDIYDQPTLFTHNNTTLMNLDERPFICASSTSWTEDEDFSVLLNALLCMELLLQHYNLAYQKNQQLLCIITGKGEQKQYYSILIDYFHSAVSNVLSQFEAMNEIRLFPNLLWKKEQFSNTKINNDVRFTPASHIQQTPQLFQSLMDTLGFKTTHDGNQFLSILAKVQSNIVPFIAQLKKFQPSTSTSISYEIFPLQYTHSWFNMINLNQM
jgi:beta-1,4-mannosyltransferase